MEHKITKLLKEIPKVEQGRKVVLGIDGLSRSGKTTFVQNIEQHLNNNSPVCIFHIDDFIVERKRRYHTGHEEWYEYYYLQWDVKWLEEELFQKLKIANELELPTYNHSTDSHDTQRILIPDTCLIIIEGIFLQRPEWRNYYDYVIYLDSSRQKRFERESEITQSNIEKFNRRYWKAEDYYLNRVSPKERADLVIQN